TASHGSTVSVTLLLVIDASSMIGSYTERFTVPVKLKLKLKGWVSLRTFGGCCRPVVPHCPG
ncbi:hypothetical protein, partial [Streptomyces sp. NPDC058622]|uniref:hypothetical protein n=1 Tax=Streptomyces sp. NPDC058622 TaxID=3346562 RepID=UPI0036613845